MGEENLAYSPDGSEYSRSLAEELEGLGVTLRFFERSDQLEMLLDDSFSGVLIVSPHVHQARQARAAMRKAGGATSRLPLLAVVKDVEQLAETDTLKHFDDFVIYPGGASELIARIRLLDKRRGKGGNVITQGELIINLDAHQVTVGGYAVDLTYKEYELLKTIAATPGRAYSREELLRSIWGYDYFGGTRTVDVHVRRLRSKIETTDRFIETVHGVGYRFASK